MKISALATDHRLRAHHAHRQGIRPWIKSGSGLWRTHVAVLAALLATGCASIVEGTTQTLTIATDPAGAECELSRGGEVIAVANPTPASVVVDKSQDDIAVACVLDDHLKSSGTLTSGFQGMTFGNLLFGGLIGIAIDAGSGAMHEYEPTLHIVMTPERFTSKQARDAFYAKRAATLEDEAAAAIAKVESKCRPTDPSRCRNAVATVEAEHETRLAALDEERARALVAAN